jgi:hypothetical protein
MTRTNLNSGGRGTLCERIPVACDLTWVNASDAEDARECSDRSSEPAAEMYFEN